MGTLWQTSLGTPKLIIKSERHEAPQPSLQMGNLSDKEPSAVDTVEANVASMGELVNPYPSSRPTNLQPAQYPFRFRAPESDPPEIRDKTEEWPYGKKTRFDRIEEDIKKNQTDFANEMKSQDNMIQCLIEAQFTLAQQLAQVKGQLESLEQHPQRPKDETPQADDELAESDTEVSGKVSNASGFVVISDIEEDEEDETMDEEADEVVYE
ncbi:unnamed protein product [Penicillium bialowiezense]